MAILLSMFFIWLLVGEFDHFTNDGLESSFFLNRFLDHYIDNFLIECSQNDLLSTPPFENIIEVEDNQSVDESVVEFFSDFVQQMKEDRLESHDKDSEDMINDILKKFN